MVILPGAIVVSHCMLRITGKLKGCIKEDRLLLALIAVKSLLKFLFGHMAINLSIGLKSVPSIWNSTSQQLCIWFHPLNFQVSGTDVVSWRPCTSKLYLCIFVTWESAALMLTWLYNGNITCKLSFKFLNTMKSLFLYIEPVICII